MCVWGERGREGVPALCWGFARLPSLSALLNEGEVGRLWETGGGGNKYPTNIALLLFNIYLI